MKDLRQVSHFLGLEVTIKYKVVEKEAIRAIYHIYTMLYIIKETNKQRGGVDKFTFSTALLWRRKPRIRCLISITMKMLTRSWCRSR
ncbi:hypothetical protein Hanom_Chr09g00838431 [Helianthus anomalus]